MKITLNEILLKNNFNIRELNLYCKLQLENIDLENKTINVFNDYHKLLLFEKLCKQFKLSMIIIYNDLNIAFINGLKIFIQNLKTNEFNEFFYTKFGHLATHYSVNNFIQSYIYDYDILIGYNDTRGVKEFRKYHDNLLVEIKTTYNYVITIEQRLYNDKNLEIKAILPREHKILYEKEYNECNLISKIIYPDNYIHYFEYDNNNNLIKKYNSVAWWESFEYDNNLLIKTSDCTKEIDLEYDYNEKNELIDIKSLSKESNIPEKGLKIEII